MLPLQEKLSHEIILRLLHFTNAIFNHHDCIVLICFSESWHHRCGINIEAFLFITQVNGNDNGFHQGVPGKGKYIFMPCILTPRGQEEDFTVS